MLNLTEILNSREMRDRKIWLGLFLINIFCGFLNIFQKENPMDLMITLTLSVIWSSLIFYFAFKKHGTKLIGFLTSLSLIFILFYIIFFIAFHSGSVNLQVILHSIPGIEEMFNLKNYIFTFLSFLYFIFCARLYVINRKIKTQKKLDVKI